MAAGGLGLARLEGHIIFLPGVLPDEEVEVEILEGRSGRLQARPLEIVSSHPARRTPPCPLFLVCGGCQLMHVDYGLQPSLKACAALEKVINRFGRKPEIVAAPEPLFYRDRVRLKLSPIRGRLALGFYGAGSHRLIPLDHCHQLNPGINRLLSALADWVAEMTEPNGAPTQLEILAGPPDEGFLLLLDLPGRPSARLKEILDTGPEVEVRCQVFHTTAKAPKACGQADPDAVLTWLVLEEENLCLKARPGAFTQVNREVNRLMVRSQIERAREIAPSKILDLYSGLGNFTFPLARTAGTVVGVERSPISMENARINQKINQVKNTVLIRSDSAAAVEKMATRGERYDLVVLDPPRAGARGMAPHLARLSPREILYFSCHPAALARDLAEFVSLGYQPDQLTVFDMFPQTAHMEVLARLKL